MTKGAQNHDGHRRDYNHAESASNEKGDPTWWLKGPHMMAQGTPHGGSRDPTWWLKGPHTMAQGTPHGGSMDPTWWFKGPHEWSPSDGRRLPGRLSACASAVTTHDRRANACRWQDWVGRRL
ncbi:hypothetical protein LSAT2_026857 [Lamellibrachia satsuma]|nr:hypothetical protein LSAT2_026857 [Lamellibrachia satsuma]